MLSTLIAAPPTFSSASSLLLRFSSSCISRGTGPHHNDAIRIKSSQRLSGSGFSDASPPSQTRAASTSTPSFDSSRRPPSSPSPSPADDRGYDADAESDSSLTEDEHRKGRKGGGASASAASASAASAASAAAAAEAEAASSAFSSSWPGSDVEDEDDASKSSAEDDEEEEGDDSSASSLRDALFEEALTKVPELGWSHEALAAAARQLGLSPAAARLARRGPADLALWFIRRSNDEFAASLGGGLSFGGGAAGKGTAAAAAASKEGGEENNASARLKELAALPGTTARIEAAIWWRLQPVARFSSSWHQAVAAVALAGPRAAAEAARELWRWSDDAWTLAAGDRPPAPEEEDAASKSSSSYASSYYSKRATLLAVYAACELHLLADFSPDHEETRRSVRRRLEDAAAVAKFSKSVLGAVAPSPGAFAHFAAGAASRAREAACGPAGRGGSGRGRRGGAEWEGGGV